ncbi:MAG: hypothetical protein II816_05415 [Elusimicrobia bacterium]|nr:hypothetical protein [Elusimicrobiota bacterium]
MNRKLLSLVLAAVFTVSLGVGSALARVDLGNAGDVLNSNSGSRSQIGFTIKNSDMERFAQSELGNLVTVFGYSAGVMTYQANKTGITYIDSNGMKAAFSVSEDAGKPGTYNYTMTSIVLSGTDIAAIQAAGGLKNFLISCGMDETALRTVRTEDGVLLDNDGNEVTATTEAGMVDAAWLTDGSVDNWLAQGINFSATISLGGSEPQVTLSENGKQSTALGSFNGESYIAAKYNYNNDGSLNNIVNAQLQATTGQDQTTYALEYSVTVMDEFGRQSYTFAAEPDKNSTWGYKQIDFDKTSYDATTQSYQKTRDTGSGHTTDFTYSANGSLVSYTDNTSGSTYHYVAGQMSYVTNNEGSIVTSYAYNNGIMRSVQAFNGNTVASITVFDDFGRNLGTCIGTDTNGNVVSYDTAVLAIQNVLNGYTNLNTKTGADACIVQSIQIYKDYVGKYDNFLNQNDNINFSAVAGKTYGYNTAIASTQIATGDAAATADGAEKSTTTNATADTLVGSYNITLKDGTKKTITISNVGDIAALSYDDAVALCNAAGIDSSWIRKISSYTSLDTNLYSIQIETDDRAKAVLSALNIDTSLISARETRHEGVGSWLLGAKLNAANTTTTISAATASLSTTCYAQGIATKSATTYLGQKTTTTTTAGGFQSMDPAVSGTFLGTTVIDGRTYAMIGNAEMNVLDGSGFQAVEGETVYVDITGNENMISAAQGEEVMFMGDVAQSTNGNLTIAMNVNYGGGFVSGSAEISAMKAEITQVSQTVSMARDALELGEITQAEYDSIIENSGWIGTNTAANLEKFANGNFSWDENKTALENLRDAFDILLNF